MKSKELYNGLKNSKMLILTQYFFHELPPKLQRQKKITINVSITNLPQYICTMYHQETHLKHEEHLTTTITKNLGETDISSPSHVILNKNTSYVSDMHEKFPHTEIQL